MRLGHGGLLGRALRNEDTSCLGLGVLFLAALVSACSGRGSAAPSLEAGAAPEVARAQAILAGSPAGVGPASAEPLGARASTIALAQSVEALAVKEGAGARASELHALAAGVLERVWRVEGREQDGREAIDLYRAASQDLTLAGACAAAVRGAWLTGELARDASVTYGELYRVQRKLAGAQASAEGHAGTDTACARGVEDALVDLAAFRPPARVLESIDQGLAGEGAIASATADAGVFVSATPQLLRIDPWPGRESARVVLALSRPARFRPGDEASLPGGGPRTFVDLDGTDIGSVARDIALSGIVTRVHSEATSTGTRVTLDLDGQAFRRVFYLPEPYRVVIDIARHPPGAASAQGRRAVQRVVLDPGHGGSDPGAIGPTGIREKDVTLDVAHRAAPILAREGMQVVLSRDDDRAVTLEERTARANGFGADLFVSIHCNAAEGRARHGVETYVLDTTKDEIASRVAARENATSQAATAELGSILASMRLADQASRSTRLAELMQKAAIASLRDKYKGVTDGGVHTAGFYVLVGARMPSILFETSYISNPTDEERLASDDYRQRLADAIANAVRAYREGR